MVFILSLFLMAVFAAGVACISGFGIGSLLTPLLSLKTGMAAAIAGVSIAHLIGTSLRFWKWRQHINKRILLSFGLTSALGGLIGALLHHSLEQIVLTMTLGVLLVFAGISGLTGLSERWHLKGPAAWMAGAVSGVFGGLVGNQGGIRSAAMLGFDIKPKEFVATATGIALAVDLARVPVYSFTQWEQIQHMWPLILIMTVGVVIGTEIGVCVLGRVPEKMFKKIVSGIILIMGILIVLCPTK